MDKSVRGGVPTDVILDTGAEVSVLTERTWTSLPVAIRINAKCHEYGEDRKLNGLGGSSRALTIAKLQIEVGGITLSQQFWIVSDFPYNLLGAPWMKDTKAIIDCQQQTATLKVGSDEAMVEALQGVHSPPAVWMNSVEGQAMTVKVCGICPEAPEEHKDGIQRILECRAAAENTGTGEVQ